MVITRNIFIGTLAVTCLALLSALGAFGGSTADASTTCSKYASTTGSDSAPGTLTAPFRTAQKLASSLSPGETGCLRQGTYTRSGTYVISMTRGGTSSAPITITSYPGERATLQGIVQVPAGDDYVNFSDLTFEGTGEMNTIKIYSTGVRVEDSEITNAWRGLSCMMLGSESAGQAVHPVISGNVFHACGSIANGNKDHGIYASDVLEGEIVNNLFYDTAAYAIQLYPNAQRTTFAHNVIDGSAPSVRGGLVFGGNEVAASNENVVEQNVIAFAATYDIASIWGGPVGSRNVARNNCLYGGGSGELSNGGGLAVSDNLSADPQFQNRSADDFRLAATSPCLSKVGYDTVAMIESAGVEIPEGEEPGGGEGPVTEGSTEEPPLEGSPEEEKPTRPRFVEGSPIPSPRTERSTGSDHHGGSKQGSTDGASYQGRVSVHVDRKRRGLRLAVAGRVFGGKGRHKVRVVIHSTSGWRRTATAKASVSGAFSAELKLPAAGGKLRVQAIVAGVGSSPVTSA